jgi:glycosyltransferase involved in cell wall biosynthesis
VKRVLVITNNPRQASFRLRIETLLEPLALRGINLKVEVRPRSLGARRRLLRSAGEYDAIILQRKLLDGWDARLLARSARRVFLDVDDAVMYCQGRAGIFARWRTWRRFVATAKNVDRVVAGNEYLADLFRRRGAEASVLPTVVDVDRYTPKVHAMTNTPTLVWIGSRSTLPYLDPLMPALTRAAGLVAGLKLLVIADAAPVSCPIPMEHATWSVANETQFLCRGDIGIAPTPSDPWTQGKCGFKIIQYMAAGLPTIASPVGANAELVVDGATGYLPKTLDEWPQAIAQLAQNLAIRTGMGAAARLRAQREYSLQRAVDFWEKLLQEA